WSMVGESAPRPWEVQFPFPRAADGLVAAIKKRQVDLAGKEVVDAITALQPYPGGNDWLCAVDRLDIEDKHKLIVATGATGTMSSADFAKMVPGITPHDHINISLESGAVLN